MPFEIPPWVKPANTGEQYARGMALGVQIAQQNQRIKAQQEAAAMDAAIKIQQLERESQLERQRVMIADAYNQQRLDLERQQVEQAGAINQMKINQASLTFAAQKEYQRRVMAGEDPATVALELFPLLGLGAGDWGAAMRSKQGGTPTGPVQGEAVLGPNGEVLPGLIATPGASGGMNVRNIPGYRGEGMPPGEKAQIRSVLEKRKEAILAAIPPTKPKDATRAAEWDKAQAAIAEINEQINGLFPWLTNKTATVTAPAPRTIRINRAPGGKLIPWSAGKPHEQYE